MRRVHLEKRRGTDRKPTERGQSKQAHMPPNGRKHKEGPSQPLTPSPKKVLRTVLADPQHISPYREHSAVERKDICLSRMIMFSCSQFTVSAD